MPRLADSGRVLSENLACDLCGLSPARRRAWVAKRLLPEKTNSDFNELETIELGLLKYLHDLLGPSDAAVIWRETRDELREKLLNPHLDLVIGVQYREAEFVTDPGDLASAVRTTQLVRVIPFAPVVARLRAAFRRMTQTDGPRRANRSRGRNIESG